VAREAASQFLVKAEEILNEKTSNFLANIEVRYKNAAFQTIEQKNQIKTNLNWKMHNLGCMEIFIIEYEITIFESDRSYRSATSRKCKYHCDVNVILK